MKKLTLILAIGLGLAYVLSSCVKGDDLARGGGDNGNGTNPGNPKGTEKPKVQIASDPGDFVRINDSVNFQLILNSNSTISTLNKVSMQVFKKESSGFRDLTQYTKEASKTGRTAAGHTFGFTIKDIDFNSKDSIRVKFTIKATNGKTAEAKHVLVVSRVMRDRVIAAGNDSVIRINHKFTNSQPPDNKFSLKYTSSAYQMGYVEGGQGDSADIADNSPNDSTFTREWTANTSTMFVKANNSDINFNNPLDVQVTAAYDNGSPSSTVSGLKKDDLIVARVRDKEKYILIKIHRVFEASSNPKDAFIEFKARGKNLY